ncbi:MAG: lysozyme [Acidobacteriota bacterium]
MTQNDPDQVLNVTATKLTAPAEGDVLHVYYDPNHIPTIGYGSIWDLAGNRVTPSTPPITQAQALMLLERELRGALGVVEQDVPVPLTMNEEAALTDFVFNVGAGNFEHSTLLADLRAGNYAGAADEFLKWDHAGGVVLAGLARRCAARRALFLEPDGDA